MNKIKSLFKASPIAMAVVSLVIAGVASAAIVSYISNAPTATVTVSAPVAMGIYEGVKVPNKTGAESLTLAAFGGDSMPFTTTAKNQSNNRIGGYYVMVIEAENGDKITGQEITSMMFDKNKGSGNPQNGEILSKLCVVEGNGSLTSLSAYTEANRRDQKLVFLFDVDGASTQESTNTNGEVVKESNGICSSLTLYGEPGTTWTETRSFFHLDPNETETETWTFTPKWNAGAKGIFTISAQYVNDLAKYAAYQY